MIYVDILPYWRGSITPHQGWAACSDFLAKSTVWKRKQEGENFTVEKPGRRPLSQVIKVNINGDNHVGNTHPDEER